MQMLVGAVLAAWRHAERLAGELPVDHPDRQAVLAAAERLRVLYQDLTAPHGGRGATGDLRETLTPPTAAEGSS